MSRLAAAAALACTIVLVSSPSHARGFRFSAPKITSVKPAAATAAAPARSSNSVFIWAGGSRPAGAAPQQQMARDPDGRPSLYQPVSASTEAKPAATDGKAEAPKELTAAPSSECAVKEQAPAKEKEAVAVLEPANPQAAKTEEPAKTEPARSRSAFLVPVVNKHPQAPVPRRTVVCFVQRDGTCAP